MDMNLSITKQSKHGRIITFKKTISCIESLNDIINNQAGVLAVYDIDNDSVIFSRLNKDGLFSQQAVWKHVEKYTI